MSNDNKPLTYYQRNKQHILERQKERREEIKKYFKDWYMVNRERILKKRRTKLHQIDSGKEYKEKKRHKPRIKKEPIKYYPLTVEYEMKFY